MPDILGLLENELASQQLPKLPRGSMEDPEVGQDYEYSDEDLLELWKRMKKESVDQYWVWERQWQRNLWYILGRQWIEYFSDYGGWREKRLAPTVPRPVTNLCKDTIKVIRSIFTGIHLGVNVRPNGQKPENVIAASVADELSPVVHERHHMTHTLNEFDFWLLSLGNAYLHTFLDYDLKYGTLKIDFEECVGCQERVPTHERPTQQEPCATCGGVEFAPAMNEDGTPYIEEQPKGRPCTVALSPLEVAHPNSSTRFADIPYIVRRRWRTKWYFENHPTLKDLVPDMPWAKSSGDRTLQLYRSLANHNDLGVMPTYLTEGSFGSDEEGLTEYEVQMKPCDKYPQGLVFRVVGDQNPKILHLEESEAVPGPLPYTDADGQPLFTWTHAGYDPVGGRILASSPIDLIIQKQDQLNQLDSMILMTMMRMAAGGWIIPKGSEIENITKLSTPGVIVRWNPNTVGGNAKPERFEGVQINDSWFKYRDQIIADIEKLTSTYDIIKGAKPAGVEAFSALQLLVEQAQSAYAWPMSARGEAYKDWFKFAIELEREFGPDEFTNAVLSPARTWTFETFQRTQLQGSISIVVEDGSNVPKTSLGLRASVQQAQALAMLDMTDSDTRYEGLKLFGLQRMVPTLDVHIQAALQKQQTFEEWIVNPEAVQGAIQQIDQSIGQYQEQLAGVQDQQQLDQLGPAPSPLQFTPLKWLPWFKASIHKQEFEKWANSDRVRELLSQKPEAEALLTMHYQEMIDTGQIAPPQSPGGGAEAMENSNRESTTGNQPAGTQPGKGPA